MKRLLDVTDSRTRLLQFALMMGSTVLGVLGLNLFGAPGFHPAFAIGMMVAAVGLFVVTAGIKQRWEIEYRGHRVRFENSPVFGEKLFLDEGLVAKGGVGIKMEMRAPIRVGEGAGEVIVALVDAGLKNFRLRLFAEAPEVEAHHEATLIEAAQDGPSPTESSQSEQPRATPSQTGPSQTGPSQTGPSQTDPSQTGPSGTEPSGTERPPGERARAFADAADDLRPVTQNAVLGTMILAKNAYETIASVVGLIGGVSAAVAWLF